MTSYQRRLFIQLAREIKNSELASRLLLEENDRLRALTKSQGALIRELREALINIVGAGDEEAQ
jgi:hypothetical protein